MVVITSCTNRKRVEPAPRLRGALLGAGDVRDVAREWSRRLRASRPSREAREIYCGRGFREAEAAAAHAGADLFIVSAGIGLVSAEAKVPSYSLTITPGSADNVLAYVTSCATAADWWGELVRRSPFTTQIARIIAKRPGPILIALPGSYLRMIGPQLEGLPVADQRRLRVFTRTPNKLVGSGLQPYVMPYDARFDGKGTPFPGTHSDFCQRALQHFVRSVLPGMPKAKHTAHAEAVDSFLARLRAPNRLARKRLDDEDIAALINRHWDVVQGQSGRMLRLLRDKLQIACEQSRFRDLFRAVKAERRTPA